MPTAVSRDAAILARLSSRMAEVLEGRRAPDLYGLGRPTMFRAGCVGMAVSLSGLVLVACRQIPWDNRDPVEAAPPDSQRPPARVAQLQFLGAYPLTAGVGQNHIV